MLEAYSFVRLTYTIGIGVEDHPDYQWRSRGGFTSHQYGEWAIKSLSGNERPKVGAIQYSSPGFVRFEVKREGVETLLQFVDVFRKNKTKANETYRAASTYLREAKADDVGFIPENHSAQFQALEVAIWTEHEAQSIGDTISKIAESNFSRLHVAMWFHRRIAELEKYQDKGMVFFPRA